MVAAVLMGAGILTLAALASYEHTDPSWNTDGEQQHISNIVGRPGAWVADLLLQTLGIGGVFMAAGVLAWGARMLRREPLRPFWLRVVALMLAGVGAAIAFAQIPSGEWTVHPYLGSSAGTLLLERLHALSPLLNPLIIAATAGLVTLSAFLFAAAFTKEEFLWASAYARAIFGVITLTLLRAFTSFFGWFKQYNDPGYEPDSLFGFLEAWKKPEKPKKRAPRTKIAVEEEEEEEDEDSESDEIAVPPPQTLKKRTKTPPLLEESTPSAIERPERKTTIPVVAPPIASSSPSVPSGQQAFALPVGEWELPDVNLLQTPPEENKAEQLDEKALRRNAELLKNVLNDFGVQGDITSIHPGPVVTLYELEPAPGTKSSKIIGLSDDIARSMSAVSVRCAVVPGRNVIGIELPNKHRQTVYMQDLLASRLFEKTRAKLPLILGKDISGQPILADLAKMPHLLVAGTTGSGKSVAVNTMILSLLFRLSPEQCRFIMIDPKMLELSVYDNIPHLLAPVVTEPGKAVVSLKWTVQEMENRYRSMSKLGVRNIEGYNARLKEASEKGETIMTKVQTGFDTGTGEPTFEERAMDLTELPYIVVVVDEFADLMLVAGKDVESAIQRLAQMARAAGIHLIMATQRPSVDVITGVIKANFPTRISFAVTSKIDSRTILGEGGAEQLLGMGDMLYMAPGGRITRVHGPFVSDSDVERVVGSLKTQGKPDYVTSITEGGDFGDSEIMAAMFGGGSDGETVDEFYDQAVALVAREGKASTSFVQRYLQIGYNRAARIIEEMERQGIISAANAVGKREILVRDFSDL
ncbi:MAG: DNA translocase FtsK 4TM domain-containing protein [Alphaproteobacteria bacterium]|nr:DNA translocase FtsK 4TM domain-containing protein [Alphaproteobacteria bacterium]